MRNPTKEGEAMKAGNTQRVLPWYREPWPWILMSGPATVVVAGIVTAWLAVVHEDALVVDDYYKQGLAINRTLAKQETAARLGMAAELQFADDGGAVRVFVTGAAEPPQQLALRLVHATRAQFDQSVVLERTAGGWYEARLSAVESGRWTVLLEDLANGWRLGGQWHPATEQSIRLEPAAS
jgi:hypothetical protein